MTSAYVGSIPREVYLQHHGIKGMHWGQRRFQNEDGSYTAAGKARYGVSGDGNGRGGGSGQRMSLKQRRAQGTYERIKNIKNDENRMARMSGRQQLSLKKAERYWKDVSQGKKPTEKRNFIKREADWYRSYNAKQRAGITAAGNVVSAAGSVAYNVVAAKAGGFSPRINAGMLAKNTMSNTMSNLLVSELLYSKVAGHF